MRRRLLQFGLFAGLANLAIFFIVAVYLGGDAVSGKAVDGHYFLSNRGHLTEVSQTVFNYSRWHVWSVLIAYPIAMLCAWRLSRKPEPPA